MEDVESQLVSHGRAYVRLLLVTAQWSQITPAAQAAADTLGEQHMHLQRN